MSWRTQTSICGLCWAQRTGQREKLPPCLQVLSYLWGILEQNTRGYKGMPRLNIQVH